MWYPGGKYVLYVMCWPWEGGEDLPRLYEECGQGKTHSVKSLHWVSLVAFIDSVREKKEMNLREQRIPGASRDAMSIEDDSPTEPPLTELSSYLFEIFDQECIITHLERLVRPVHRVCKSGRMCRKRSCSEMHPLGRDVDGQTQPDNIETSGESAVSPDSRPQRPAAPSGAWPARRRDFPPQNTGSDNV